MTRAAAEVLFDSVRELNDYGIPRPAIGSQVQVDEDSWMGHREAVETAQADFAAVVRRG